MYCNEHMTSSCLCGYDCDYVSLYSASLRVKSSTPHREPPHESSCCCNYNPFTDETKDTEIHDLGFALRKLAVMKCQMKKWRMERLQLESETRSLKNKLQSLGVNVNVPMTEEPLIIHYRDENSRLEKIREQLEDKIKDLETTVSEHELYRNPCEGIQIIREKMRALREQSHRDKKKLEDTIRELTIKLAESGGESPCAGVNRLRAKLRELIDQLGEKKIVDENQQFGTIIEKSDDLRVENERIRMENQNLRRALRPTGDDVDIHSDNGHSVFIDKLNDDGTTVVDARNPNKPHDHLILGQTSDDTAMGIKLRECNHLIEDLRKEITEKDDIIRSLQKKISDDVELMRMKHETLKKDVANDKAELQRCEKKVEELLNQLGQSSSGDLESDRWNNRIGMEQPQFDELKIERDKLLNEVNRLHKVLADKDDQMNKGSGLINLEGESSFRGHKDDENQRQTNDSHSSEADVRITAKETDEIGMKNHNLEIELNNYKNENEKLKQVVATLQREKSECESEIKQLGLNFSQLERSKKNEQGEVDALNNTVKSLRNELATSDELKNSALLELSTLRKELDQLIINLDISQRDNSDLKTEQTVLKQQIVEIQEELSNKNAENVDLKKSLDKPTSELNELQVENQTLKKKIVELERNIENFKTEITKHTDEIIKLNQELENSRKDLETSHSRMSKLDDELANSKLEKHELDILHGALTEEKLAKDTALDKIKNLDEELGALKSELMNYRNGNEQLRNDLNDLKQVSTQLNQAVNGFRSEVEALKSYNEKLKSDNELLKRDSIKSQDDFQIQKIEADTLKLDNTALKGERDRLQSENSNIRTDLNNLKNINENISSELESLKSDSMKCYSERDKLKSELENISDEYAKNKNEYDFSAEKLEALKKAHDDNENQVRNLESSLNAIRSEKESLLTALSSMRVEGDELKRNIIIKDRELREAAVAKQELVALKDELIKCREELERCHRDLDSSTKQIDKLKSEKEIAENQLLTADKKIDANKIGRIEDERDGSEKQLDDSRINIDEIKLDASSKSASLEEMIALKNTLGKLRKDLEKCNTENKQLHRELDKWKNDAAISKLELEQVKNENIRFVGEIEAVKNELANQLGTENGAMNDGKIIVEAFKDKEDVSPKDMNQLQTVVDQSSTEIERLTKENAILKNNGDMSSKISQLQRPSQISRERPNTEIPSDTQDMSNELMRALDVIRMKMEKQRKGVIRLRANINNMAKQIWSDSSRSSDSEDSIILNTMNPIVAELLELSNDLSTNILCGEKELIDLSQAWKAQWEENVRLKKLVEDLGGAGTSKTPGLSGENTETDGGGFDPESWLASLTLTQLADLHDKICSITSNLVAKDCTPTECQNPDDTLSPSGNQDNLQQSYEVLNKKIAALQREIAGKQTESSIKVFQMRQILQREQAKLIRISEAMNQEKRRNLMLQCTFHEPPCWINDCTAECAKSVKFISNGARGRI